MDLLQNTDQHRTFGPFLDIADGVTPLNSITVTDVTWVIARDYDDGTASTHNSGSCSATGNADWELVAVGHGGLFHLHIPDSEVNWAGEGKIELFNTAVFCPVWENIKVKPANVLAADRGTDYQKVDVEKIKDRDVTDVGSGNTVALGTTLPPTAVAVRQEMDANSTKLANLDATISSRHASGAAVAKSPATLDWSADVTNKPTIGTSTITTSDVLTQCGTALTAYDSDGGVAKESSITTILNRLGAWTGSGINTILGAFKALFRKDASAPSDIGGTFTPAAASVAAIAEAVAAIPAGVAAQANIAAFLSAWAAMAPGNVFTADCLANAPTGGMPPTVDGISLEDVLQIILAASINKTDVNQATNTVILYARDGVTPIATLTYNPSVPGEITGSELGSGQ